MFIPLYPETAQSGLFPNPVKWAGNTAPSGAVIPWSTAPLGSEYTRFTSGSVAVYVKLTANANDADWVVLSTG